VCVYKHQGFITRAFQTRIEFGFLRLAARAFVCVETVVRERENEKERLLSLSAKNSKQQQQQQRQQQQRLSQLASFTICFVLS